MPEVKFLPVPKPEPGKKKKGGKSPKQIGSRVERQVMNHYGGERTPGSGAFKHGSRNLTGDGELKLKEGKAIKFEIKYCGTLNSKGEKVFPMNIKVVKQMIAEAEAANQLGALHIQYKNEPIKEGGLVVMWMPHFTTLAQLAGIDIIQEDVVE